jgi:hypothetical protein
MHRRLVLPALDSDVDPRHAGPGNNAAFGHCRLDFATRLGLCTFSRGTGTFTPFRCERACLVLGRVQAGTGTGRTASFRAIEGLPGLQPTRFARDKSTPKRVYEIEQRSLMSTTRTRRRITSLVGAIVMLLPVSLAMAQGHGDPNRPIEVTFTKWVTTFPLMEGFLGRRPREQIRRRGFSTTSKPTASRQLLPACAKLRPHHSARGAL